MLLINYQTDHFSNSLIQFKYASSLIVGLVDVNLRYFSTIYALSSEHNET